MGIPKGLLTLLVSLTEKMPQVINFRSSSCAQGFHSKAISAQLDHRGASTFLILLPIFQMPLEIYPDPFFHSILSTEYFPVPT